MLRNFQRLLMAGAMLTLAAYSSAQAEEKKYVGAVSENLLSGPGGSRMGQLYRNTEVEVLGYKGKYAKIRLTGWLPAQKLIQKSHETKLLTDTVSLLKVEKFDIRTPDQGSLETKAAYLVLTAKNTSDNPIPGFRALLVVKHKDKVLFREPVTYQVKPIGPNGSADVIFSWDESEEQYDYLTAIPKDQLEVKLLRPKVLY